MRASFSAFFLTLAACAVIGSTAACSSKEDPQGGKVEVTSIQLSQTSVTLEVGGTVTLTATVSPSNATDKSVTWRCDKPSVASIDQKGLVTALSAGTCTVSASSGSIVASCTVQCNEKKGAAITGGNEAYGYEDLN